MCQGFVSEVMMPNENISPNNERVVLYARVSTGEQASEDHFSIQAQIYEMQELAAEHGWEVVGEYVDEITGTSVKRPELETLLAMAERNEFEILLVHELSRLSRASVYKTLEIFELLGQHQIGFASVKESDFDFTDPNRRFFLILLAAINQYYVDLLRLHTSKAKRQRAREGLYNASITPYGYKHTGGPQACPVVVERDAEAIKLIFEQYANGRFSMREVADKVNDAGYRTRSTKKSPKGGRFGKAYVAEILRNRFYTGKIVYDVKGKHGEPESYPGLHEAIISTELWDRCQRIRKMRQSTARVKKPYRVYLLSNLAYCDVCQHKLRSQGSSRATYYREMSADGGYNDCPNRSTGVQTEGIDAFVHAIIQQIKLPKAWLEEIAERSQDDTELQAIRHQHARLEAERRRLKQMKIRGEFDQDAELYYAELNRIRRELDQLPTDEALNTFRSTVGSLQDLPETWAKTAPIDQRDLLRTILQSVAVDVPGKRVVSVQPKAIFRPIFDEIPILQERENGFYVPVWSPETARELFPDIPQLPPVTAVSEQPAAWPFMDGNPLLSQGNERITPGLRQAMGICRAKGLEPQMLVQCLSPGRPPLRDDVRQWSPAVSAVLTKAEVLVGAEESLDVLATQFWIWDSLIGDSPEEPEALIAAAWDLLRNQGVWYLQELLPLSSPAHWVYQFFPEAWAYAREAAWCLQTLYLQLQGAGFTPDIKRHVYYQPVQLGLAVDTAQKRPGILKALSERAYQRGLDRLEQALAEHGAEYWLGSEMALVEIWAQKSIAQESSDE